MANATCSVDGCDKVCRGRGLCGGHYTRWRNGKPIDDKPLRDYVVTDDLSVRLRHYAPISGPDECWEWRGSRNKDYGVFSVHGGKVRVAHVVAWELHTGRSLPKGTVVRHRCDNPPCVNPAHLLHGTHADNVGDKVERERQSRGEGHGIHKLTEDEVREIRRLHAGGMGQKFIARKFAVSQSNVSMILAGKTWAWLK